MLKAEQTANAIDELYALADFIPQFIWIARADGNVEYHNQRWLDYVGLPHEETLGDVWVEWVHPEDRQQAWLAWQKVLRTGEPYEMEQRMRDSMGVYRWFLVRGVPQKDAQGTVIRWIGTSTDIDKQKRGEQTLQASEEQWKVLSETLPQFVWATRADGYLEYWNQRYVDYFRVGPEQLLGYAWRQFLHPDDVSRVVSVRQRSLEMGEPYEVEYRLKAYTGVYHWFLTRGMPVRDAAGQIIRWFGTCTDIDDQKHTEEALRKCEERVRALMASAIIGIAISEGEHFIEVNETFARMTGYTRAELESSSFNGSVLMLPENAARHWNVVKELATCQQAQPYETVCVCKDGHHLPILLGMVALPDHPQQVISFMLDNSARKELEQRKDDFISMAGHELKTPLTSLKLQTQLLSRRLLKEGLDHSGQVLTRIEAQVGLLERLISELLNVSRVQSGKLQYLQETVDLDELLHEIAQAMEQISATHTIVVRGAEHLSLIGDRDRLGQVFTNLLTNAIKYSPQASLVEVDVNALPETVSVSVRDQGIGIPREQREKIFERFYRAVDASQKEMSGLGIGLYIVAEIVQHYGGTITVDSEIGQGSTFRVILPRIPVA